jgi:hypothetical protein
LDKHSKTAKEPSKEDSNALWITYLNIVLYALCYQLQRPVVSQCQASSPVDLHHDSPSLMCVLTCYAGALFGRILVPECGRQ